jgi:hypothetical protein
VNTEGVEVLPVRSGVMPDHVHLVSAPNYDANDPVSIAEITQAIGVAAAHRLIGDGRDAVLHFGLPVS